MTKKTLLALLLSIFALGSLNTLTACNTTEGFRQDVEKTGEYIQDEASGDDDDA